MNKITCPHCGKEINIEKNDYDSIISQINQQEIEKEIKNRENQLNLLHTNELKQRVSELEKEHISTLSEKDKKIIELQNSISQMQLEKELEISKAIKEKDDVIMSKDLEINKLDFLIWESLSLS